jgi:hypothetical protein
MAKNKYYLAELYVDYNDNYDLISTNIKYTLSELKKLGFHYLDDIPSYEMLSLSYDEICDDVLEYNKLTELLWDYLFYFEICDDEVKVEDITLGDIKDRLDKLTSEYFVLRYKKQENKFSIVKKKEIERLSNEIIFKFEDKSHEFLTEFLIDIQKMIEFDDNADDMFDDVVSNVNSISHNETYKIDNFFNELESLIEHESCVVSLSNGSSFSIFKDNGRIHKEFIKSGFDKNNKPNKNGNHYEFNEDELKNFVLYHLLIDRKIGFSISAFLKKSENKKIPMSKKYGFYIYIEDNEIKYFRLKSKDIYDSFTTDAETGKFIKPDENAIYCGKDKNDFICGFDQI